jgi:hypothetical protein
MEGFFGRIRLATTVVISEKSQNTAPETAFMSRKKAKVPIAY